MVAPTLNAEVMYLALSIPGVYPGKVTNVRGPRAVDIELANTGHGGPVRLTNITIVDPDKLYAGTCYLLDDATRH